MILHKLLNYLVIQSILNDSFPLLAFRISLYENKKNVGAWVEGGEGKVAVQ